MYESWYARLVSPDEALAVWIRYTIDKAPGKEATGTLWFTLFDSGSGRPLARRLPEQDASVPPDGWVLIGGSAIGPDRLHGECFEASWDLTFSAMSPPLFHLPRPRLYELPLPRTKPVSPVPFGEFAGEVRVGERTIDVSGWRGMVGHNWGAEHAERWIWLHGCCFEEEPDAWIDVAMGRVRVAGLLLPWVANGAVRSGGTIRRVGGMSPRGVEVIESAGRLDARLPLNGGGTLKLEIDSPRELTVGWGYADPEGGGTHEVANCSAAAMKAWLTLPGEWGRRQLSTGHGAAYELGMTETDHGVPIESGFPGDRPVRDPI